MPRTRWEQRRECTQLREMLATRKPTKCIFPNTVPMRVREERSAEFEQSGTKTIWGLATVSHN